LPAREGVLGGSAGSTFSARRLADPLSPAGRSCEKGADFHAASEKPLDLWILCEFPVISNIQALNPVLDPVECFGSCALRGAGGCSQADAGAGERALRREVAGARRRVGRSPCSTYPARNAIRQVPSPPAPLPKKGEGSRCQRIADRGLGVGLSDAGCVRCAGGHVM